MDAQHYSYSTDWEASPSSDFTSASTKLLAGVCKHRPRATITKATGCDTRARPHRLGYQVILDQAAGEELIRFLGGTDIGN